MMIHDMFNTFFQPQVIVVSESQINEIKRKRLQGEKESLEHAKMRIQDRITEVETQLQAISPVGSIEEKEGCSESWLYRFFKKATSESPDTKLI